MKTILFPLLVACIAGAYGQISPEKDTVRVLEEVIVQSFAHQKPLREIPASIALISKTDLQRFNNTNFLPALNINPGVRMEERSPGSYRLSIRGSSLRSPFGVRNIKVYWNGMPLTDPGGNTYLNLIDFSSVNYGEVIKGPGSSLYGAGTGGVLLLESKPTNETARVEVLKGSYGLNRISGSLNFNDSKKQIKLTVANQNSDGYRSHTEMKRTYGQLSGQIALSPGNTLSLHAFTSALFYETPGGLTLTQYQQDPTQARPAGGPNPGAVIQQASVKNNTSFAGIGFEHEWNDNWITNTVIFGNTTLFKNPAIRNYEERQEQGAGFRTSTRYRFSKGQLSFGAEAQTGQSSINIYQNLAGVKGTITSSSKAPASIWFLFAQSDFDLPSNFFLTAGLSLNQTKLKFSQTIPSTFNDRQQSGLVLTPRLALSKKINSKLTAYISFGQGYSPPTTAEVFPSTAVYNKDLKAEIGTNYEGGLRGTFGPFDLNLTAYHMSLNNTIVVRQDASGADYFINAGSTKQRGIESIVSFRLKNGSEILKRFKTWISYSFSDYTFEEYIQGVNDYSGNRLTGTPKNVISLGLDFQADKGVYFNITANYVDRIPLNDANSAYADEYYLFGMRAGYKNRNQKFPLDFFAGIDNAFDRIYSLGNDLNAAAGRYYNLAPGRSFYFGVIARLWNR